MRKFLLICAASLFFSSSAVAANRILGDKYTDIVGNSLKIYGSLFDAASSTGINGNVLMSTGTSTRWQALTGGGDMLKATYDPSGVNQQLVGESAYQLVSNKSFGNSTYLDFNVATTVAMQEGRMAWDNNEGTVNIGMPGGNVNLSLGQEMYVPRRCKNQTGATIQNGSVVFINGVQGNTPTISLANASSESSSTKTIGLATEDISNSNTGYVTTYGIVRDVNTNGWTAGTKLWLSTTTSGAFSNTRPPAPYHATFIGYVIKQGAVDGEVLVNIQNGYELDELHDVWYSTPFDASLLGYNSSLGYWTTNDSLVDMKEPTGFQNTTDSAISFATSTRTFSITGNYNVYYRGKKIPLSSTTTKISNITGTQFIYFNSVGQISTSSSPWNILNADLIPIATAYWNASSSSVYLGDERHGITMDALTHSYLHNTVSSRYQNGFSLTADNNRATTSAGIFWDEDLSHQWGQQTTFDVLNRNSSGYWDMTNNQNAYYRVQGGNLLYDNAGASTTATLNNYVAYWIFASNSSTSPIISIMGQRQDTTIANARANNTYDSLILSNFPFNEAKLLWRVMMRNVGGVPTYIEMQDMRAMSTLSGGGTSVLTHGTLAGLSNDDHTQYLLVDGTRSATQLTVSGTTTLQGLVVDSTGSGGTNGMVLQTTGTSSKWVATSTLGLNYINSDPWGATTSGNIYYNGASAQVGIATSVPAYALDVVGKIRSTLTMIVSAVSNLTTTIAGEFGIDTTSGQWRYFDGTATRVLTYEHESTMTIASSTWNSFGGATATSTLIIGAPKRAETWTDVYCITDVGTSSITFQGAASTTQTMICGPDGTDTALSSNNVFAAREKRRINIGTFVGNPNQISITITKNVNED